MKDKHARVLAVIALVFMLIFIVSLTATLIDYTWLNGGVGIIAICSGVFVLMVFIALKADGRGFSLTKMKNESEMQKIEQALKEQEEAEKAQKNDDEQNAAADSQDRSDEADAVEQSDSDAADEEN